VGLYTLPLLIWHPMQLVIGTFLAPKLAKFVEREHERLGIVVDDNGNEMTKQMLEEQKADVEADAAANDGDEERIPTSDEEPELDGPAQEQPGIVE
jgi:hypothetical protein